MTNGLRTLTWLSHFVTLEVAVLRIFRRKLASNSAPIAAGSPESSINFRRIVGVVALVGASMPAIVSAPANADAEESGWIGFGGGSATAATVAGVLSNDGSLTEALGALSALVDSLGSNLSPDTLAEILAVLADPEVLLDPESSTDALLSIPGLTTADIIGEPDPGPEGGETETTPSPSAEAQSAAASTEEGSVAAASSYPDQADNGQPKAWSSLHWLLRNSHSTRIYYGHSTSSGYVQDGYMKFDFNADLVSSDDFNMALDVDPGTGPAVTLAKVGVLMRRDINNASDTTAQTYECPTSGTRYYRCYDYENIPHTVGNWYYIQMKFRGTWVANGATRAGDFTITTRRNKVTNSSGRSNFPAYSYFGG